MLLIIVLLILEYVVRFISPSFLSFITAGSSFASIGRGVETFMLAIELLKKFFWVCLKSTLTICSKMPLAARTGRDLLLNAQLKLFIG